MRRQHVFAITLRQMFLFTLCGVTWIHLQINNLPVDTLEFVSHHVEDKICYLNQLAHFHSNREKPPPPLSNVFQKPLLLQLPLNSLLHPRAMTSSYFFLWSNCCFLSAVLCHGVQGHVSDCCIITSSKVGETAAGDQQVRAGPASTLKPSC